MARKNKQRSPDSSSPSPVHVPRQLPWLTIFVVAAALGLFTLWLLPGSSRPTARASRDAGAATSKAADKGGSSAESSAQKSGGASSAKPATLAHLVGRWVRTDGGYVLKVKEIAADGKVVATYLNPSQINVSQANATKDDAKVKLFVELRDVNYPGCTYDLTFDSAKDQLTGTYYQAAIGQSFDVVFERQD